LNIIIDIETDDLYHPKNLWLVGCKNIDTGEVHVFENVGKDPQPFLEYARRVDTFIGHNLIGFDLRWLNHFTGLRLDLFKYVDTLVVSRTLNFNLEGGHSLEAWGERLKEPKGNFKDFSKLSEEMRVYLRQDLEVTHKLYLKLEPYLKSDLWKEPLILEHQIAFICKDMNANGFAFDLPKAKSLYQELDLQLSSLKEYILKAFPPKVVAVKEVMPQETKKGTLNLKDFRFLSPNQEGIIDVSSYAPGHPFTVIKFEPFNPSSTRQIVERLNGFGWEPVNRTKGHIEANRNQDLERLDHFHTYGWKVDEENLATLPEHAPEAARKLVQWLLLRNRHQVLGDWVKLASEANGRIHGQFLHIGAWTGRMSHNSPNMANIPSVRGDALGLEGGYGKEFRELWTANKGGLLIGADADAIQLRILAHYMNDARFTEALINGKKELGTDAHTLNMKALGRICGSRDLAKTFIYAFLLGAGIEKIANILKCTYREAKEAVENFLGFYPKLEDLKYRQIPKDSARGYFRGLDGRLVLQDSDHLMLAGYLQNGEAVIMKKANIIWRKELKEKNIPFKQVNFVHDEWQVSVPNDTILAQSVGKIMVQSLVTTGEILKLNCPLAGNFKIGLNWFDTH
jgi:DNA polymerase-1